MKKSDDEFLLNYSFQKKVENIKIYPDLCLTRKSSPLESFNQKTSNLAETLLNTMYKASGIGLAAPQIGINLNIFAMDVDYKKDDDNELPIQINPHIFINPVIENISGSIEYQEGCLSMPGVYETIKRTLEIKVSYFDLKGNQKEMILEDLPSICVQHETDHLHGIVFLEYLSSLKKSFYTKKLQKYKKNHEL